MQKNTGSHFSFFGAVIFFISIAVTVSLAVVIYGIADNLSDGNVAVIAVAMLISIVILSALCTVFDLFRRKFFVEVPIKKILDATKKITDGKYDYEIQITHSINKYTEYDIIMENINLMAKELAKTEVLRTDFISNVSHELKTPLSIISNYAMALKNDKLSNGIKQKYLDTLVNEIGRAHV